MKKIYKLTVEPIAPVHIGTGEVLTLLDYKVVVVKSNGHLVKRYLRFSSENIMNRIAGIPEKAIQFEKIASSGNMQGYFDFFNENCSAQEDKIYLCVATNEFLKKYDENRQKDPMQNAAQVFETFRNEGAARPVIPGSSLKGSIRTAVLQYFLSQVSDLEYEKLGDEFDGIRDERQKAKYDSKLQKTILENNNKDFAKSDPFRSVEIADCDFAGIETQIVGLIKNISQKNGDLKEIEKLQIQTEAINGSLTGNTKKAESLLRINEDLQNIENGVSKKISIKDIIEACNDFYLNQFNDEYRKFYKEAYEKVDKILELSKILKAAVNEKNTFILRVGRWSQCEAVTFEEPFRAPKTSKDKRTGNPKSFGETRSVFNFDGQYIPMGWCKCTVEEIKN